MKQPAFSGIFRFSLVLSVTIGLLLLGLAFLPFETAVHFFNQLAPDGNVASLTEDRYQLLSRVLGFLSLLFIVPAVLILSRWAKMQPKAEQLFVRLRDFNEAFRYDAAIFVKSLSPRSWNRIEFSILLGLILVAVITRLASLNIPLTHDEAYTYNTFASGSLWQTVSNYPLPNNHVLLSIMINLATNVFGNQPWFIRLPTMVAGVLMVPACFWAGARLYSRETGLLSAALVAVFPILVQYSILARGYVIISFITLLILALGDYVRENKNRFAWLLLSVFSALGFYTVPVVLFPLGALYLWLLLSCMFGGIKGYPSRIDFLRYCFGSGVITVVLTAALYAPILVNDLDVFLGNRVIAPLSWDIFPITMWVRTRNTWVDWTAAIPQWIVLIGVLGLVAGLLLHKKIARHKFPLQFAFLIWITLLLITRRPNMVPRMWLFLAAPLLIWSAGGLIETLKLFAIRWKNSLALEKIFLNAALIGIFIIGVLTIPTIPSRWSQKSSLESAAMYLQKHLQEGDLVTASTKYLPQLKYYFEAYTISQEHLRRSGPFPRAFIIIGQQDRATLESVLPKAGFNQSLIDLNTVRPVLEFDDLILYEGYPVP